MGKDAAPDFAGTIGRTIAESRPFWPGVRPPPKGAPNILRSLRRSPLFRFRPLRLAHPRADDRRTGGTGRALYRQALDGEHVGRAEMARQ
ncbi:MAG: hypothetical protein WB663_02365 [Beijerinckiaceae bacterium]